MIFFHNGMSHCQWMRDQTGLMRRARLFIVSTFTWLVSWPTCVWLSEASVLQTLVFMFLGVLVKQNAHLLWRSASQRSLQINELGRSWACGARRIRGSCLAPTAAANPAQLMRGVYVSETAMHSLVSNLSPPPFILFQSC